MASRTSGAFTLIELLVVVAILAVLLGILMPAAGLVRNVARQSQCLNILRQLQLANASYAGEESGTYVQINSAGSQPGWYTNVAFLDLLDVKSQIWPRALLCPASNTVLTGANRVAQCYGANVGVTIPTPTPIYAYVAGRIARPSDKLAWADGWDWWINAYASHKFDYERQPSLSAPTWVDSLATAYRHQGKACVAYYDGHVEARARNAMDTGMVSGAAKSALETGFWDPLAP